MLSFLFYVVTLRGEIKKKITLFLPSAVFIAQVPVGPSKQLKQIFQIEHNILKNPNCDEVNRLALYKRGDDLNSGLLRNKSRSWSEQDLNPGLLDYKSDMLTARPGCLHKLSSSHAQNALL